MPPAQYLFRVFKFTLKEKQFLPEITLEGHVFELYSEGKSQLISLEGIYYSCGSPNCWKFWEEGKEKGMEYRWDRTI